MRTRTLLASIAVCALVSGQALAAPPPTATGSSSPWSINGIVGQSCILDSTGATGAGSPPSTTTPAFTGVNVTVTPNAGGNGGKVDITNFTVTGGLQQQNWSATISLPHATCSSGFTITAQSTSGALALPTTTTVAGGFASSVKYSIGGAMPGTTTGVTAATVNSDTAKTAAATILTSTGPAAGNIQLTFAALSSESAKFLQAGTYSDNVTLVITPLP